MCFRWFLQVGNRLAQLSPFQQSEISSFFSLLGPFFMLGKRHQNLIRVPVQIIARVYENHSIYSVCTLESSVRRGFGGAYSSRYGIGSTIAPTIARNSRCVVSYWLSAIASERDQYPICCGVMSGCFWTNSHRPQTFQASVSNSVWLLAWCNASTRNLINFWCRLFIALGSFSSCASFKNWYCRSLFFIGVPILVNSGLNHIETSQRR